MVTEVPSQTSVLSNPALTIGLAYTVKSIESVTVAQPLVEVATKSNVITLIPVAELKSFPPGIYIGFNGSDVAWIVPLPLVLVHT